METFLASGDKLGNIICAHQSTPKLTCHLCLRACALLIHLGEISWTSDGKFRHFFFCTLCPALEIFFSFLLTDSISGDRDFNQANTITCLRQSRPGNKRNFEALPSYISCNIHGFTVPHRQHAFRQPSFNLVPMHLLLFMAKKNNFLFPGINTPFARH